MLHESAQEAQRLLGLGEQVVQGEPVDRGGRVGEVGVDLEAVEVADHQEGRVVQRFAVLQQLAVGGGQVLALALVLPGEVAALPHVGEAVAALHLAGALLEGVVLAGGVGLVRSGHAQHAAQVDEVLLGGRPLGLGATQPTSWRTRTV